jgi:hypothetical protein
MTRAEFRAAYREARKVQGFIRVFAQRLPDWPLCSLVDALPLPAWLAACRYGDRLAFAPARRADGRYRSRVG